MAYDAKQIAKAAGGLTLAGAPEGFDALVMADIARARGGLTAFVARDTARSFGLSRGSRIVNHATAPSSSPGNPTSAKAIRQPQICATTPPTAMPSNLPSGIPSE